MALDRNRFNCSYRAGWVMKNGTCVKRQGPPPPRSSAASCMVGDSVSWRADDELLRPPAELGSSTCAPAAASTSSPAGWTGSAPTTATPDQLIVQLGTNRRQGFNEGDFRATMASIPASTPVLFLLPVPQVQG